VRFVAENKEVREEEDGSSQPIRGVFTISQIPAVHLQGGQALLTFEEDKGTQVHLLLCSDSGLSDGWDH